MIVCRPSRAAVRFLEPDALKSARSLARGKRSRGSIQSDLEHLRVEVFVPVRVRGVLFLAELFQLPHTTQFLRSPCPTFVELSYLSSRDCQKPVAESALGWLVLQE